MDHDTPQGTRLGPSPIVAAIIAISIALLAGVTVFWQEQQLGLPYVEGEQLARHHHVLSGDARSPWRYRLLAEWMAAGFVKSAQMLHVPRPVVTGFLGLRLLQNSLIFVLAFLYYCRLGLDRRRALIGVMVLAFTFTHAIDNSDLSFNTYFDVLFYLLGTLLMLSDRVVLFLGLVVAASLNRETSALIPFLPLAEWAAHPRSLPLDVRRRVCVTAIGCLIWLSIFAGLRLYLGVPSSGWQEQWQYPQGLPLVLLNLSSSHTLVFLALTFSILPLLTLWDFKLLPDFIKGAFWLIVPLWCAVHISLVRVNETRLFLVPIAAVLIPGALYRRVEVSCR